MALRSYIGKKASLYWNACPPVYYYNMFQYKKYISITILQSTQQWQKWWDLHNADDTPNLALMIESWGVIIEWLCTNSKEEDNNYKRLPTITWGILLPYM